MRQLGSPRVPRLVAAVAAVFAATALVLAGATSASAHDPRPDGTGSVGQADAAVLAALERDLGLSQAEVAAMRDALTGVDALAADLEAELGASFGGSWFDPEAAGLVVAVTDPAAARTARAAGARPQLVAHSKQELDAVQGGLDALAEDQPAALSDALQWTVDVKSNEVVLTVRAGEADAFDTLASRYGDAVRVVESYREPRLLDHDGSWLDGGVQYVNTTGGWSCSVGFNARNPGTGERYFITAGHCGDPGHGTAHAGTAVGPFEQSRFPGSDDATVRVTNSSWSMGAWVWTHPGAVTVSGAASSGIGTPVCASGMTTGLTCGEITDKNVTVNYAEGAVFGMGQHNACTEPGDSGGSVYSTSGGNVAQGVTSGGQMIGGMCLGRFGMESVSFYQEITDSLNTYSHLQLW